MPLPPATVLVFLPMTGVSAPYGVATEHGIRLAEEHQHGRAISLQVIDTRSDVSAAATAATTIGEAAPLAVLAEVSSSRALRIAEVAQAQGVPLVTPTATSPAVTRVGDHIFRACFVDPEQGRAMARYAMDTLATTRVGILSDPRDPYAQGLVESFTATFRGAVTQASYAEGDYDFRAQLKTLLASDPDALYLPGFYIEVGMIASQARDLGFSGTLLGGDGWASPRLMDAAGTAVEGAFYTDHWLPDAPGAARFTRRYEQRWADTPDTVAALGYDAATLLLRAVDSLPASVYDAWLHDPSATTAAPAREAIRASLATLRGFRGVTGTMSMGPDRNPRKPVVVARIRDGVPTWAATIGPE